MMAADAVRCMRRGTGGGGDDGSPHTYWRIEITSSYSVDVYAIQIAEMQFRAYSGGPSESVGGTASASPSFAKNPQDGSPSAAFDNSIVTTWTTAESASAPWFLAYQHTEAISVGEVMLQSGNNATRATRTPIDFEIQYSDNGTDWTTALTVTDEPSWGISEIRTYTL